MKYGHRLEGQITTYDQKGRGILVFDTPDGPRELTVPFTALGDTVQAAFVHREHGAKIGKLEQLLSPGADRTTPFCPHAGICGGCLWQHLQYDAQLRLKKDLIHTAFERAGHAERITEIIPCPEPQRYYRNRMDYAVGWNREIGLKEYGSWNRYVNLSTCDLLSAESGKIMEHVRAWIQAHDLQPWDAKHVVGDIRYVMIREGKRTQQRLINVVAFHLDRISSVARQDLVRRLTPYATSILLGEQSSTTDLSLAQRFDVLSGTLWLEEETNGLRYRIHPNSFFQTNTQMAEILQHHLAKCITTAQHRHTVHTLLDLYCGLGFFSISLASQFSDIRVAGYELDAAAIELATVNASQNHVAERTTFTSGPAEDLSWKELPADLILVDPPRSGLHPKVRKALLEKRPATLLYVSCNYARLAEELKEFKRFYTLTSLTALDLFPHTPHIEVVAELIRT